MRDLPTVFDVACRCAFVGAALITLSACATPEPTFEGRASIIDGDTLEIHGNRIRLWGVDAPEARQTCDVGGREERCGRIAAERLAEKVAGAVVACFEEDTDRYGRSVATCHVQSEDLGAWLVREGLAVRYVRYAGQAYLLEEIGARRTRRGVWAGAFEMPEDWRREQREKGR